MLPVKLTLTTLTNTNSQSLATAQLKLNLIVNSLLYDQLTLHHFKYVCVTKDDILSVQVVDREDKKLLGTVHLGEVWQMAMQGSSATMNLTVKECSCDVKFVLNFQALKKKKKVEEVSASHVVEEKLDIQLPFERKANNVMSEIHESANTNFMPGNTSKITFSYDSVDYTEHRTDKQNDMVEGSNESLQMLAQQREKILGELFGKFKRQK